MQLIHAERSSDRTQEERSLMTLRALVQSSGADPSSVLEQLFVVVSRKDWRRLTDRAGGSMSFQDYLRAAQWKIEDARDFVEKSRHRCERPENFDPKIHEQMEHLRGEIDRLLPKIGSHGAFEGNRNAVKVRDEEPENEGSITTFVSSPPQRDASYYIRRLRRDAEADDNPRREQHRELYERVTRREISPNRAAIEAGYRPRMISIPADPVGAARCLARNFTAEQRQELARLLLEGE